LGETLPAGAHGVVVAGVRDSDGMEVALKQYLGPEDEARREARREYELLRKVESPRVVRALDLVLEGAAPTLVLERNRGLSLDAWVHHSIPAVGAALSVARALAEALAAVHAARIVHREVTPHTVLVDPASLAALLSDFGLAQPLGSSQLAGERTNGSAGLVGSLRFMAPEQTGRMDRGVDSRSDLYALGATLYFLFTGRAPFESADPLELIHAHLACIPAHPAEHRPDLPVTVSRIVLKLLQKSPEDRYQTAGALVRDLATCADQLVRTGAILDELPLATADAPHRPLFGSRLYGREAALEQLRAAYDSVVERAQPGVVLIRGAPGIGKSALVSVLRTALVDSRARLAPGKFDLYRRDQPYLGFVRALESWTQQVLTESDARLDEWRQRLLDALGGIAGALVALVPDLGHVVGATPPVPQLGPAATRARLYVAVQRFFGCVATRDHPFVLFLDDLQWSDEGSRELLAHTLRHAEGSALLVVGAYRDGEVGDDHTLLRMLDDLAAAGITPDEVALGPIGADACAEMLAVALGRKVEHTRALARCVGRKTGNTPLLIQQFVHHVYDLGLLRFEPGVGWTWDDAEVASADVPDGAVGLMTAKVGRLDPGAAAALRLASCVGDAFELSALTQLSDLSRERIESGLFTLCDEGLIAPARNGFRFVHDRIREAAHASMEASERQRIHHRAARLLLEGTPEAELPDRAMEIADHLNAAGPEVLEEMRARAIELNVLASKRALATGVATIAEVFLGAARARFSESDWETHPELAFELHSSAAEAAFQLTAYDRAAALLTLLETRARSERQRAGVVARRLSVLTLRDGARSTLPEALRSLRTFGIRWSARPSWIRTRLAIWRADRALRNRSLETLFEPFRGSSPDALLALIVTHGAGNCLTQSTVRLMCLSSSLTIRTYLRHGYVQAPGLALAAYAVFRLAFLRHLRGAKEMARAAEYWCTHAPRGDRGHLAEHMIYACIHAWTRPRRSVLEPLRRVAQAARESGDVETALYATLYSACYSALVGEPLSVVARRFGELRERLDDMGMQSALALLAAPSPTPAELDAEIARIHRIVCDAVGKNGTHGGRMRVWPIWLGMLCTLRRYDLGYELAEAASAWAYDVGCAVSQMVDYVFYWGLAAAELGMQASARRRRRYARRIRRSLRQLRRWAADGPDFVHLVAALEAEAARLHGAHSRALTLYARAAEGAQRRGYTQHAALLQERRADCLAQLGRDAEAVQSLRHAVDLYKAWGAVLKMEELEGRIRAVRLGSSAASQKVAGELKERAGL
jgi:tetratricopeptide (TPR) repeat protein